MEPLKYGVCNIVNRGWDGKKSSWIHEFFTPQKGTISNGRVRTLCKKGVVNWSWHGKNM